MESWHHSKLKQDDIELLSNFRKYLHLIIDVYKLLWVLLVI